MNPLHLKHLWDLIKFITSCIGKNGWYWYFVLLMSNLFVFFLGKLALLGIPFNNFSIRIIPYPATPTIVAILHLLVIIVSIVLLWLKTFREIKTKTKMRRAFGYLFIFWMCFHYISLFTYTRVLLNEVNAGVLTKQIEVMDAEKKKKRTLYFFEQGTQEIITTRSFWMWPLEFRVTLPDCSVEGLAELTECKIKLF